MSLCRIFLPLSQYSTKRIVLLKKLKTLKSADKEGDRGPKEKPPQQPLIQCQTRGCRLCDPSNHRAYESHCNEPVDQAPTPSFLPLGNPQLPQGVMHRTLFPADAYSPDRRTAGALVTARYRNAGNGPTSTAARWPGIESMSWGLRLCNGLHNGLA